MPQVDSGRPDFGILQRLSNTFSTRHLTYTNPAGAILQDDDVTSEEWRVGSAQIEQHAIVTRDRNDCHICNDRRG